MTQKHLVTAALPYANGPLHIGHIAGCYLPADIYVRFLRLKGEDVVFVCGSDEHGVPITIKAKKENCTPQEVVDRYNGIMKQAFEDFGINFDIYSRTSKDIHHQTASEFFKNLYDKGVFEEEYTEQYYDEEAKQFLADRYIIGECPKCHHHSAYGDQCENCGSSLNPTDLINPKSVLSGSKPVLKSTKNWFLPLDKYQQKLEDYIDSHRQDWKSNVYGQCKSWLNQGLQKRAMTRDLDWGVQVPLPEAEGKVLYVWFDAPIGYISATKELLPDTWKDYWQNPNSKIVHFIGKDNIVFHCLIFPAMLMAHGNYQLADNVPANEFLNLEGGKISTSRNWAIWLHEYLQDFPGKESELRYVLSSIAPETSDSEFTWKDYQARVNNELVAILGNLANRVLVLIQKYYEGKLPQDVHGYSEPSLQAETEKAFAESEQNLRSYKFRLALQNMMDLARAGNKYLTDREPWKQVKTDPQSAQTVLMDSLYLLGQLSKLMQIHMPHAAARLQQMMSLSTEMNWDSPIAWQAGAELPKPSLLFERIEDEVIEKQIQKLQATAQMNTPQNAQEESQSLEPVKPEITFDDFAKLDIRVATIIAAEKVEKADKLLKITLDTGLDTRTVVSGIALHFKPEEIVGKQVCALLNLAPRKMRGIESQGMILFAESPDGKLHFVTPENKIPAGGKFA